MSGPEGTPNGVDRLAEQRESWEPRCEVAKIDLLHDRMIRATRAGRIRWSYSIDGYMWSSERNAVVVEADSTLIFDSNGRQLYKTEHRLSAELHNAAAEAHEREAVALIDRIMADLEDLS